MITLINSISDYMHAGGIVMIPIVIVSCVMWFLIIERAIDMRKLISKNMSRNQAGEFVRTNTVPGNEYQGINALFVRTFLEKRCGKPEVDAHILDETVITLVRSMDRHLTLIAVLAGIAPLLGLLGTVTGMMATFDVITVFGTGNAKAMAGGISEALITTQTGLMVSIPGLYMSGFLSKRARNLKNRISATGIYVRRFIGN